MCGGETLYRTVHSGIGFDTETGPERRYRLGLRSGDGEVAGRAGKSGQHVIGLS
jgi:hypothetical protein